MTAGEADTTQAYTTTDVLSVDCDRGNPPNTDIKLLWLVTGLHQSLTITQGEFFTGHFTKCLFAIILISA